jgi:hypothetical protein
MVLPQWNVGTFRLLCKIAILWLAAMADRVTPELQITPSSSNNPHPSPPKK